MIAVVYDRLEVAELLIDRGADMDEQTKVFIVTHSYAVSSRGLMIQMIKWEMFVKNLLTREREREFIRIAQEYIYDDYAYYINLLIKLKI